jgi:glycosyltransferase involved in cell wall biosynthesis
MNKRILYIQYNKPAAFPPLEHSSLILADHGWEVLFLGISLSDVEGITFPSHERIRVKLLPACPRGWRQKIHFLFFCVWSCWWTISWRPSWIYASDYLSAPAALIIKKLIGMKLVYHEHDWPGPFVALSRFVRICLKARHRLGMVADIVIFPNSGRGQLFSQELPAVRNNIHYVWNCPTRSEAVFTKERDPFGDMWVIYHGSIAPDRVTVELVHALVLLPEQIKLRVIGYETEGCRGYLQELKDLARRHQVEHRLEILGTLSRVDVLTWCRKSDIGLSLMPMRSDNINIQHIVGASNKAFDNLACGIPLLVSNLTEWRAAYVEPGYALACNPTDPDDIARTLLWYLEHPRERREMGEAGRRRIAAEWNYESQFAPIMTLLEAGA